MVLKKSLQEGYQLGYTNEIEQGMSGGPVLDQSGRLIAINGRLKYPLTNIQKLGTVENADLAIVTFSSSIDYPTANVANSDQAVIGTQIFVFGYPALDGKLNATRDFEFSPGFVTSRPIQGAPKGFEPYTIRYNAVTKAISRERLKISTNI